MTWRALGRGALGLAGALALAFAAGELAGWRMLAGPAERWLGERLGRPVHISHGEDGDFRLSLWRGIRLQAAQVRIDAPAWSGTEPLFDARQLVLHARWRDLLGWRQGEPLPLRLVSAGRLDAFLVRRADGLGNWQAGTPPDMPAPAQAPAWPVRVDMVTARDGRLRYTDPANATDIQVQLGLADWRLQATASGRYQRLPVQGALHTGSLQRLLDGDTDKGTNKGTDSGADGEDIPASLRLSVGRAQLRLDGLVRASVQLLQPPQFTGRYSLRGPSLAAVGQPLGLTLPTTAAFEMAGRLARQGPVWHTVVDQARIGSSRLDGAFEYDTRHRPLPRLVGRLHASTLVLADLGPAVGTPTADQPRQVRVAGRVIPDRNFDLPALRAMNADVLLRLDRLDFGTSALQSAAPLNGHLVLDQGLLTLDALDATLAQGRVQGRITLDGRATPARWQAALDGRGLRLEQWVRAVQRAGQPPYAAGLLGGRVRLAGQGRSTAELLASADGRVALHWTQGRLSHLLVEAAGLDIAQGLGLLVRGDDALQVRCGIADLAVHNGRVTPGAFVVDTRDSRLWLEGSLSLADERLALLARVQPKDFSPLTLRAPLHIGGTLGQPALSLDKPALARRAVPAALLAMVHPLAGLIPLLDPGEPGPTQDCRDLVAGLQGGPAR